jgi:hypothetical protein
VGINQEGTGMKSKSVSEILNEIEGICNDGKSALRSIEDGEDVTGNRSSADTADGCFGDILSYLGAIRDHLTTIEDLL